MLSERVAEAEHQVVLFLEVEELVADVQEEAVGEAYLQVGELIGGACLFRPYDIIPYSQIDRKNRHHQLCSPRNSNT